jgi:S-adenosylmethionine/arginine decarboxylase-like enzyme
MIVHSRQMAVVATRGLHTVVDMAPFVIGREALPERFVSIKAMAKSTAQRNHLNVVDRTSPNGFTMALLLDESHISLHCYSERNIGKLALDVFSFAGDPIKQTNTTTEITEQLLRYSVGVYVSKKHTVDYYSHRIGHRAPGPLPGHAVADGT